MRTLILFLFIATFSFGHERELDLPYHLPDSVKVDSLLSSDDVKLIFNFKTNDGNQFLSMQCSLDEKEFSHSPAKDLTLLTTPGTHQLQFFMDGGNYLEEYIHLVAKGQHTYYFTVLFQSSERMIFTEKPVIYLYPKEEMEVQVEVEPKGEFTFTYPAYKNGWNVTASPDGSIVLEDQKYNYLFWESTEKYTELKEGDSKGFVISGNNSTAFLEEKLTFAGLNAQERTDFITFWAPRMTQHENVFIQFKFNSDCDDHAKLNITPKPDEVYRIYILWRPTENVRIEPKPQEIPVMNREGFTVVEWGGQELPTIKSL